MLLSVVYFAHSECRNAKAPAPMPALIISSTSSVASPLPQAAFQPKMQILRRPQSAASPSSANQTSAVSTQSLKDREARYHAARERIFGENSGGDTNTPALTAANTPARTQRKERSNIVRNPKGPSKSNSAGFKSRNRQPPLAVEGKKPS